MKRDYAQHGLSMERYRWDVLFAVPRAQRELLMKKLYTYLNDAQIDTALRKILGK